MKIRMKTGIAGTFHGNPEGVKRGDVVDIEEIHALRYIANDYAERVSKSKPDEQVAVVAVPADEVEIIGVDPEPTADPEPDEDAPKPLDEDEDSDEEDDEVEEAKPRPGRPVGRPGRSVARGRRR